ncbi:hypothetical protein HYG93_10065 [Acinetobacter sp. SwsAc6]|uniref:hypothetical protein n=1 Tax=unclassified Acinetobacter TaxID=196816 RepID=UPI000E340743|nr:MULTISPECIES: hypothetical protein [unclassified Acinetobacter]NWK74623.1 hypothetical protein [Acinetobacter sp. SwsAc6]RFS27964.1 hypothetical protein DYI81_14370 [Acinetobacter sp. SWAC5]
MNKKYSTTYRIKTIEALEQSKKLDFENIIPIKPYSKISNKKLEELSFLLNERILPILISQFGNNYRGASCINFSAALYAWLNALNCDAEIVFGEVEIFHTDEFDVTLENLTHEYKNNIRSGVQNVHAWVTIGDDIIIDACLPDRIFKYYKVPQLPNIFVTRAYIMAERWKSKYKPMLIGSDFINKTNNFNPIDAIPQIQSMINKLMTSEINSQ